MTINSEAFERESEYAHDYNQAYAEYALRFPSPKRKSKWRPHIKHDSRDTEYWDAQKALNVAPEASVAQETRVLRAMGADQYIETGSRKLTE